MSYFDPEPRESDRERYRKAERKRKLVRFGLPLAILIVALTIDLLQAKFVYHDMGCMIARCVITKSP